MEGQAVRDRLPSEEEITWRQSQVALLHNASTRAIALSSTSPIPENQALHRPVPATDDSSRSTEPFTRSPQWEEVHTVELQQEDRSHNVAQQQLTGCWRRFKWFAEGWLLIVGIGCCSSLSGCFIERLTASLASLRFGFCTAGPLVPENLCPIGKWVPWGEEFLGFLASVVLGTLMAACSAALCYKFAPAACGSGIPEVKTILNGFVMPEVVSLPTLAVKIPGLALSVAAGMALGKEGPLVHVAICWAQLLTRFCPQFHNEAKRRELFSAAAAAGVSTAFGAPLGGVLFSLEEVSSYFPASTLLRAFTAAVVAASVLTMVNTTGNNRLTLFSVETNVSPHPIEYIFFVLLGAVGGLVGAAFNFLNVRWTSVRLQPSFRMHVHPVLEVAVIACITAATSWPLRLTRPLNVNVIHAMFEDCDMSVEVAFWWRHRLGLCTTVDYAEASFELLGSLLAAAFIRFAQTVITFGTACPAGLFVPSLFTGACLGRFLGVVVAALNRYFVLVPRPIQPGVYAMVGAAATLGGVCRVTISLVVIMLELTGDLSEVVPFMLAVLVAKVVGDFLNEGIYDLYIVLKGYPYLPEAPDIAFTERCCDVMQTELQTIDLGANPTMEDVRKLLQGSPYGGFPVVTGQHFIGYIHHRSLFDFISCCGHMHQHFTIVSLERLLPYIDRNVMRMVPDAPLSEAHKVFTQLKVKYIFIVDSVGASDQDHLQGILSKKDYIKHLKRGSIGHRPEGPNESPLKEPVSHAFLWSARPDIQPESAKKTTEELPLHAEEGLLSSPGEVRGISLTTLFASATRGRSAAHEHGRRSYSPSPSPSPPSTPKKATNGVTAWSPTLSPRPSEDDEEKRLVELTDFTNGEQA